MFWPQIHICSPSLLSSSPGYSASRRKAASNGGDLSDTGPVYGAGYQVSDGRAADGSPRGFQRAVRQLHALPQSSEARGGEVHCVNCAMHSQPQIRFQLNK